MAMPNWAVIFVAALTAFFRPSYAKLPDLEVLRHERELDLLFKKGDARGVVNYARGVIKQVPAAELNSTCYGSLFKFLGAGYHALGELEQATQAFQLAASVHSHDLQNWMLWGDTLLHQLRAEEAARVYEEAIVVRGLTEDVSKLYKARQWIADWRDYDYLQARVRKAIHDNLDARRPPGVGSAEFTDVSPATLLAICQHQPNAQEANGSPPLPGFQHLPRPEGLSKGERHRVGFLTSDLGVHPVSSLLRGLLSLLDVRRYEVHVYCLTHADSWWRRNISASIEHFHTLHGLPTPEAAALLHSHALHSLVDLNGHTMHSGLPILALTPAAVQYSFLGSPMTTGASFVDYLIADPVALPPTDAKFQSERLLLLPPSYLVNDHAQLMGHVIDRPRRGPSPSIDGRSDDAFIFAALSNFQKMDPSTFTLWANILRRVPHSRLDVMQYKLHESAGPNLLNEIMARGLYPTRLGFRPQEPWIDHVWSKTNIHVALDTLVKNGHTTDLDALWAGVPLITMPGQRMENRAGASMYSALGTEHLVAYSAKEYEDLAVALAKDPLLYDATRRDIEQRRLTSPLFDTPAWAAALQRGLDASVEAVTGQGEAWHVWTPPLQPQGPRHLHIDYALKDDKPAAVNHQATPQKKPPERAGPTAAAQSVILLHVGGTVRHPDWTVVNVQDGPAVDIVAPMDQLPDLGNSSVTAIYASHCLEHASYGHGQELAQTLREWHRVLKRGGMAFISVPDLRVLSSLFVNQTLTAPQRFQVMRMMFGGQTDEHDFHRVGLDEEILAVYLTQAGFCEILRVPTFGLFEDASELSFLGQRISLNVVATACKDDTHPRVQISLANMGAKRERRQGNVQNGRSNRPRGD